MSQDQDLMLPLSQGTWDNISRELTTNGSDFYNEVYLENEPYTVSGYAAPQQFESMWPPVVNSDNLLPQGDDGTVVPEEPANEDNVATVTAIPTSTRWPGPHGFSVSFGPQTAIPNKGKGWIYSENLNKLFVNIDTQCKLRFKVETYPGEAELPVIRAMPIFTKDEHLQDVVKRCHHHTSLAQKKGVVAPEHFVRCENPSACYDMDLLTKRQSVIVPFDRPQAGNSYTEELYKFMCLNSCMTLARRPMQIVFTLEINNEVVGRCPLDIRVCACPGRDIKTEEKTLKKRGLVRTNSSESTSHSTTTLKRRRTGGEEGHLYTIHVDSLAKYQILLEMRDSLDRHLAPNQPDSSNGPRPRATAALGRTLSNTSTSSLTRPSTSSGQRNRDVNGVKQEQENIKDWLGSFGMSAYTDQFAAHGFYLLEQMETVTRDELASLRIGHEHMNSIWKEVIKYKNSCSSNGNIIPNSQVSTRNSENTGVKFARMVSWKEGE